MRPAFVFLAAACCLAALALARAKAPVVENTVVEDEADYASSESDMGGWSDAAADAIDSINPAALMDQSTVTQNAQDSNVAAFLAMLRYSEGTANQADPYRVCYGYRHQIDSFADHPAITGEWGGESIENLGPEYIGKISTAAGAYQIIRPTWKGCKRALALPDFSPASQDAAAIYLIRSRGALDAVKAGQFDTAVALCAPEWASLPGANAPGQGMRRMASLRGAYEANGGSYA